MSRKIGFRQLMSPAIFHETCCGTPASQTDSPIVPLSATPKPQTARLVDAIMTAGKMILLGYDPPEDVKMEDADQEDGVDANANTLIMTTLDVDRTPAGSSPLSKEQVKAQGGQPAFLSSRSPPATPLTMPTYAHDWTLRATGGLRIDGRKIVDSAERVCNLRGVNLSGSCKTYAPADHDHENLPGDHSGVYDTEYLDYIHELLSLLPKYGMTAFVSMHQDVWSRYCGGSGAPAWTLEVVGFDLHAVEDAGAAWLHGQRGGGHVEAERGLWPCGYQKLSAATMATCFWAKCVRTEVAGQE
ncbi:hypothetical protein NLJ89_g7671 [Agrocybe chaxingu]|uniref:Glycoside hydrolase family 5 domain-containing protein n=1 Tax=Agrocybe chaxingu TaxID=84603 RepID=A0A9W8MSW1_9AGAR|nr:hypothetical protein NLJ89_g7671 [Agrocybe chaxingu]